MTHPMRKSDRQLSENDTLRILTDGEYGILSTWGADGFPYGVPVNYAFADNKIYFHCAKDTGHKQENLSFCSKVCFTVLGQAQVLPQKFSERYESAIIFGTARKVTDEESKKEALLKLIRKYSGAFLEKGMAYIKASASDTDIYEITVESVTGKGAHLS